MEQRPFGRLGRGVSVLGQGTWNLERDERRSAIAALRHGLELGMTHVDTAELYGSGAVETLVGEAIAGRRDEIFLVSKVLPENASRVGTRDACERSLKRLHTDWLDCYLLHWRGRHPLADTIATFEELRRDGKIRSWGVSNFGISDLDELWRIESGRNAVCNQVLYHLEERAIEHEVLPWCEKQGLAVVGYSPFGSGRFPDLHTPPGRVLVSIAERHYATPHQIALAFLIRRPSLFAIPKSSSPEHTEENAKASEIHLSQDEIRRLEGAFPPGPRRRTLPSI